MTTALAAPLVPPTPRSLDRGAVALCEATIAHHSKSFALASRLLDRPTRQAAAVVYTWCRHADDAVDEVPPEDQPAALERLKGELDVIYSGGALDDVGLTAFQTVAADYAIPAHYPAELLAGMAMDVRGHGYASFEDLQLYCYRVASVVGLMMCHVFGLRREEAVVNAAHLGLAMQITNICRDVLEDWERHRLYLPDELLAEHGLGGLAGDLGRPFPGSARRPLKAVLRELLATAEASYRRGDAGCRDLPVRAAFAVRAARLVYSAIGAELARRDHDVLAGRAVVSTNRKLALVARAATETAATLPGRWLRPFQPLAPRSVLTVEQAFG